MYKRIVVGLIIVYMSSSNLYAGIPELARVERLYDIYMSRAEKYLEENLREQARDNLNLALLLKKELYVYPELATKNDLLISAVFNGYYRIVEMFLEEGLDPNIIDPVSKLSLLQIAINRFGGNSLIKLDTICSVIKVLVECKNININITDENSPRWTVLMNAAYRGFYEAIEILLSHPDIDIRKENLMGRTALDVATFALSSESSELYPRNPNREVDEDRFKEKIRKTLANIYNYQRCIELLKKRM